MSTAAKKAFTSNIRLTVPAGAASPSPPVGPALGQRGVKAIDFCKLFNDRTKHIKPNTPIPVRIKIEPNRTFSFKTTTPTTHFFLCKAANIEKGSGQPNDIKIGKISLKHIYEIALIKQNDPGFQDKSLPSICKCIIGSARNMGLEVLA